MEYKIFDDRLTIKVEGKVDSMTSTYVEECVENICNENNFKSLVLDFANVDYISSAGLRVCLRLKKKYSDFKIIDTSLEVYDIFEMTGFVDIMTVEKAFRKMTIIYRIRKFRMILLLIIYL